MFMGQGNSPAPVLIPCPEPSRCYHVPIPNFGVGRIIHVEPGMKCQYCGCNPLKVMGKDLYPERKKLWRKKFLRCEQCDAQVGCHNSGDHKWKPFGPLANRPLRQLRKKAHAAFDPIWQSGVMTRKEAYDWMADRLKLSRDQAHIGMLSEEQCERLMILSENVLTLARGRKR